MPLGRCRLLSRRRMCQGLQFIREQTDRIGHNSLSGMENWHNLSAKRRSERSICSLVSVPKKKEPRK